MGHSRETIEVCDGSRHPSFLEVNRALLCKKSHNISKKSEEGGTRKCEECSEDIDCKQGYWRCDDESCKENFDQKCYDKKLLENDKKLELEQHDNQCASCLKQLVYDARRV